MIKRVLDLTARVAVASTDVYVIDEVCGHVANEVRVAPPVKWEGPPPVGPQPLCDRDVVLYELTFNAVNFCYWWGSDQWKPANTRSLQQCINLAWHQAGKWGPRFIHALIAEMAEARFTLLNERRTLLLELLCPTIGCETFVDEVLAEATCETCPVDMDVLLRMMVRTYPGYGSDILLKRAVLFFMSLHRRMGWFAKGMPQLFVPSDYQIPKILRQLGAIRYSKGLAATVDGRMHIPAGSRQEIEIRSATIVACQVIADRAGVTPEVVDNFLWLRRKTCQHPHHLTVTTDY